jgi:hypothetical protein
MILLQFLPCKVSVVPDLDLLMYTQFMPPAPLLDEMMSAVEERVDVTRQELLTLGASLKLGWGLAVLRRTK